MSFWENWRQLFDQSLAYQRIFIVKLRNCTKNLCIENDLYNLGRNIYENNKNTEKTPKKKYLRFSVKKMFKTHKYYIGMRYAMKSALLIVGMP